jgi:hypothetical protein
MTLSPQVTQQYSLGPVKPWVQNAAYIVGPLFGIKDIGGWRKSDPFPDHPNGDALDYMVPNTSVGDAVANYHIQNAAALNVKYLVWNHRAWDPQRGWHPYTSTSNPHTDHVHVTYLGPGAATSGPAGTSIGLTASDDTCAWKIGGTIPIIGGPDLCILNKKAVRLNVGIGLMLSGSVVIIAGILVLTALALGRAIPGSTATTQILRRIIPAPPIRHRTERHIFHHNVNDNLSEME